MRALEGLEPSKVFYFFEEITKIPHGSRNTKAISDYCANFAKERNLSYVQDEHNNVIIRKPGSAGYENSPVVILQGHLDMVCEKTSDADIDMEKEHIKVMKNDEYIYADKTTLGGDDGIAVAFALTILDDDSIVHPPLEVLLTVDEEIGLLGATALDPSNIKGKKLINIDSEEEGIITVGCAGGLTCNIEIPVSRTKKSGNLYTVTVSGLKGGHSGAEINKHRLNSNKVAGKILYEISKINDINLMSINGGFKDNAIPNRTEFSFVSSSDNNRDLQKIFLGIIKQFIKDEPEFNIGINTSEGEYDCLSDCSSKNLVFLLYAMPNGVMKMSEDIEGLVQTSLNMGVLNLEEDKVLISSSIRSAVAYEKEELTKKVENLVNFVGGKIEIQGAYPGWEFNPDSELLKTAVQVYKDFYMEEPKVDIIHAGLECGILTDKIKGLDCISIGPDLFDVHTPNEKLYIESTKRTWEYLKQILVKLK